MRFVFVLLYFIVIMAGCLPIDSEMHNGFQ